MKTFFNILQKCAHSTTIRYPDEPLKLINTTNTTNTTNTNYNFIKVCYTYNIVCKIYNEYIKSGKPTTISKSSYAKIKVFYDIENNKNNRLYFFYNCLKISDIFSQAQRIYHAFTRLAHLYRLKKYKTVVTEDLTMNPLDINHKNTFVLIQNKSKYLFNLNDIVKIIETAITNAPSFFPEPKYAKNPFNNEVFNLATLYNVYFKMKSSERLISTLFHLYFLSNFDINKFALNNEPFLRETTIQKYIYNSPYTILHKSIITMLKTNYYTRKLSIHTEFPEELLVEIFKPFLYYYYITNYDIQGTQRIGNYKRILYTKLRKFYEYNITFGRKIMHVKPRLFNVKVKGGTTFTFDSNHISFHNIYINENENNDIHMLFYAVNDDDSDASFDSDADLDASEPDADAEQEFGSEFDSDDSLDDVSIS
jgi:hypothetical protein